MRIPRDFDVETPDELRRWDFTIQTEEDEDDSFEDVTLDDEDDDDDE